MKILSSNFKRLFASFLIAAGLFAASPVKAETELLFNLFVPPKHPFNTGMFIPWANDVMRVTEGRVQVKFTTATLAPPPKHWNMLLTGIADVAMLPNNF